jgi:hypothetical protein
MDIIATTPIDMQGEGEEGLLSLARERATLASNYWRDTYDMSRMDTAFAYGDQWDSEALQVRKGRPTLVLNKMGQFVSRLVGDQRQNVQSIKVMAAGNFDGKVKSASGTKDYKISEVLEGLTRNIETISNASYQYKTAFQHSIEGGFGWLRVLTDYADHDSFDLDLKIQAIRHRYTVMIDPDANEPDCSDMNWAFVTERMSIDEFRKRWPDGMVGDLDRMSADQIGFWGNDKTVVVSEYFIRKPIKRDLAMMSDGSTHWLDEIKDVIDEMATMGVTITRKRKVQTYKVLWYKITSHGVLDGPKEWVGSTIPIVPVWGKEIDLDGKREFRGLIHDAKDAQRMHNYWMSAATERVALAPKSPWVGAAENFEGHEGKWNTANITNWSYLPYNETPSGARPIRTDPPPMPSQELQIATLSEQGIKSSIGLYDASLGQAGQEVSGIAIRSRQQQGDTATFVFTDNLNMAIQRIGKILVETIPAVYDGNRVIRMHFADGTGDFVEINKTIVDEQTGKEVIVHDLGMGKYDVSVTTGPQYATQRQEAANTLLEFAKAVPQAAQVGADLIASNLDAPNMDIMAERLKKILPPNMLSPEEQEEIAKDSPPPAPPQPTPEQQIAQLDMQSAQSKQEFDLEMQQLKIEEARIKLQTTQAEAQAKAMEAQNDAESKTSEGKESHEDAAQDEGMIKSMVHDVVAQAMAEFIAMQRNQQQSPQEEAQEPVDNQMEEQVEL